MESIWQRSPALFRSWSLDSKACGLLHTHTQQKNEGDSLHIFLFSSSSSSKGEPGEKGEKGAPGRPGRVGPPGEIGVVLF